MSSIISDLFYGSKQNILDNYLVNRHEPQQSSHLKQETLLPSFIEFAIRLPFPPTSAAVLKVEVEMGERRDEGLLEMRAGGQGPVAVLTLHEIQKAELGRHTNAKITVSEGRQWKAFGFVPIESIKGIAGSFSNEKTIVVQLKGKSPLPFASLQCTIRTEFPNNNILNSQIMRSMEKDHESYIRSRHQISDQTSQNRSSIDRSQNKRTAKSKPLANNSRQTMRREESNMVIDEGRTGKDERLQGAVTQYVKEIKSIKLIFSKIELTQSLRAPNDQIFLRAGELEYRLDELIEVSGVTRQGASVEVVVRGKTIGSIHLSPLLLTLTRISGELPIYSVLQQCLGTILVRSPHLNHPTKPQVQKQAERQVQQNQEDTLNEILLLSVDKILLVRSAKTSEPYKSEVAHFDFTKMEAINKLEVLLRVNGITHRFNEVFLHYNVQREWLQVVELRRKEGFNLRYFQQAEEELRIEVEIFNAYRLIAYGKTSLGSSQHFVHKFMAADSQSPTLHCGVYLKAMRLQARANYFHDHKMGTIFNVLNDLLSNKIILQEISDAQIKRVMNFHEGATYVQLKKLAILLERDIFEFKKFQRGFLRSVYSSDRHQLNAMMIKLSQKLLQQFLYVGSSNEGVVSHQQFNKIISFYQQDLQVSLEKKCKQFISNPIRSREDIIYVFFVAGFYFVAGGEEAFEDRQERICNQTDKSPTEQPKKYENNAKIGETAVIKVEASYFISKISISNAHLLNQGRAPNISLSLGKKVSYSNSNPEFNLQREVSLLDSIKIFHKSIAEDRLVQLAEFHPLRRQTYYELEPSGKCLAKVTWGL